MAGYMIDTAAAIDGLTALESRLNMKIYLMAARRSRPQGSGVSRDIRPRTGRGEADRLSGTSGTV